MWPGHFAGASSGAMVAALAANGMAPKEILELLLTLRFRTAFLEAGMVVGLPYLPVYERRYSGATRGRRILRFLQGVFGELQIEETRTPLGIAVTNLSKVRAEVRTQGPLAEMIVASCAYPTLISHQIIGGEAFWDGGVAQSPPFAHWRDEPAVGRVIAHCVGEPVVPPATKLGISAAFALAHDVIGEELFQLRLREMTAEGKEVRRVVTAAKHPGLFVTGKRGRVYFENGRVSGLKTVASMMEAVA